ncbi:MAG TPA: signal peptide peptidase SppA [Nocardioidaceae bacterium]|nr:signal peptide peptidase SppA [Nocardioidaceae bacterium]
MISLPPQLSSTLARAARATPLRRSGLLLELDLSRGLLEGPPAGPVQALRSLQRPTLRQVVEALEKAAGDPKVRGLVAHVGPWQPSLAQSSELRAAVQRLRDAGRRTVAWTESFGELGPGNIGYHLATAFEEIWLQPSGQVGLVGLSAEAVFLRGTLDKLGVEPQIGQRYEYKTAADTFVADGMTGPHREMLSRLVESGMETIVADVAAARGRTPEEVRASVDAAPLSAETALDQGLVDRIGYRDEAYAAIREALGEKPGAQLDLLFVERYRRTGLGELSSGVPARLRSRDTVAVVQATGPIHLGRSGASPMSGRSVGSDTLGSALRAAGRDDSVRAVVLRVDSPGGSYVASDAVRREVQALRGAGTTVVASMGTLAASGGYFIAMPCEKVVANPGTLTGSIGVLAGKQVLSAALDRVGLRRESVASGRYADMFSTDRPFDEEEWSRLDAWLDEVYEDFTAKAAQDRGMDVARLRSLARGRVWSGADAAEHGLVDELGGLSRAVDVACGLAGLDRPAVQVRGFPQVHPLQRLVPVQNSESPLAVRSSGWDLGGCDPIGEGMPWVDRLLAAAGLPHGALSLPWALRLR